MISRKYLTITLLIIFLFCLNAVNASDINETSSDDNFLYQDGILYDVINDEILYEQPTSDKTINKSEWECCSFVIQEADETVYGFRQDSPLNGHGYEVNSQNWNGLNILKQEIDTQSTYFFHCIITENGWVIGQGGSQYDSSSRSIEQIAGQIVVNNDISPDYLKRIKNILAPYGYGHFFIKAPDGRYGISFYNTYLTGTLQIGQYMVIPNEIRYHIKGNYKDYSLNPVDALIMVCSYDDSGINRRNLMTYDYKVHDTVNGQYYGVDVYATNDNGRNVGLNTAKIVTHFYYKGQYYPPSVIPQNPGKLYVGTHIFENRPTGKVINFLRGDQSVLVNSEITVEYRIQHITSAQTVVFNLGNDVDFVGVVSNYGTYTYNSQEHAIYWQIPGVFDGKHIIITLKPKKVGYYNIHCHIPGISEVNNFAYYATDYGVRLYADNVEKYMGGPQRLYIYLKDKYDSSLVGEKVAVTVNGQTYYPIVKDTGYASLAINLGPGEYNVNVKYDGKFDNAKCDAKVLVKTTLSAQDIVKYYKNDTQFYASFLDKNGNTLKNSNVQFNINGVFYTRTTDKNGVAKLNINLNPGKYIITSINLDTGEMMANSILVKSVLVENNDLVKYYRNDSQYTVKVLDGQGNPLKGAKVDFNINGVFYTRTTNESGIAKLNINLYPDVYIITATYNGQSVSNKIKVLTRLVSSDLSMEYKDGSKFKVTVLDGQGKISSGENVTFNINGVFYNRTTDNNGMAALTINLMPGKYIITSYWESYTKFNYITVN
ncbi:Ig-like domain repeat protein [Methanobrevibacter sp.]|uniref:Ig-like domain repeat protein n=1 Tax=Methanobrevibacter sp. TaxID=66852 RepID=UPI003890BC5E